MEPPTITDILQRYLQNARDRVLSRLDGLSDYDIRRPLTPTATNLLGIVKHLAGVEFASLGACVGRPSPVRLPWYEDGSVWDDADMWASADESREYVVGLYRTAWRHSDESIAELDLAAPAHVPWWPEERRHTTFGELLVRLVAETAQHAGHADIVRELIDGHAGRDDAGRDDAGRDDAGRDDAAGHGAGRADLLARVQRAADAFRG